MLHDLAKGMVVYVVADAVQVAILSNGLQQQLSPVVQTAIAEALPEQFASPQLRNAMEASLNRQLQQALAKPLQDSFTASFQQQLIPAFEGACRDMFAQVSQQASAPCQAASINRTLCSYGCCLRTHLS